MECTDCVIRSAIPEDVPELARFMALSYRRSFREILSAGALGERNEAFFISRFSEQWPSIHMAETAGHRCVGLIQVRSGHLDLIFIDPACAGSGLAKKLLQKAESCGAKTLECFRDNPRARRFYEREGWILSGSYEREFAGEIRAFVSYVLPPQKQALEH